jgi:transposase
MSLRPQPVPPVPDETVRVAHAAFPRGNLYLTMREECGVIFADDDFATLFPTRGQPAAAPWRLALITIMQYVEDLSDRQAAEAVRSRIDWKYALSLGDFRERCYCARVSVLNAPRARGSPHSVRRSYCGHARLDAGIPSVSSSVSDR